MLNAEQVEERKAMLLAQEQGAPLAGPNPRRILKTMRLCQELGHGSDTLAALEHMKRMESALKILHTWAGFPPLDSRHVRELCVKALKKEEV